jgi:Mrp family chromosome partitioning ATPase
LTPTVPKADVLRRNRIIGLESTPESTTIDVMRTKVLQQMRTNGWRTLAITSPSANCGKSTLSTNLAFSFSRQSDLRTIVCDMDFRRPTLSSILGLREGHDFSRVLTGEATFAQEAVRPRPNLAFALTQSRVANSAELLQSPSVGPNLQAISDAYQPDIMIFDTPAMFASDDTMAFVQHVDCVLLIAAAGISTIREIDICETDLAQQTNIMGVVLNQCRYMEKDYSYGAY